MREREVRGEGDGERGDGRRGVEEGVEGGEGGSGDERARLGVVGGGSTRTVRGAELCLGGLRQSGVTGVLVVRGVWDDEREVGGDSVGEGEGESKDEAGTGEGSQVGDSL